MTHAPEDGPAWPPRRTAWFVAIVLMLANTLAFVDRQALALLVQPIKHDLHASDTAMSLLYGLSFTLFYVGVGIPVARLADRSNRRNIIAASVFMWSLATATCGLVRSFGALFVARVGVGAGEAGFSPSAYSLLADYFPRERLASAMGVYQMGVYLGGALALLIGGLVAGILPPESTIVLPVIGMLKGWHVVFLALGVPGLLLSLLVLAIREPVRRGLVADTGSVPLRTLFAHVLSRKAAYFGIGLGFAMMILVGNGTGAWIPAFFGRKFGWTIAEIGARYGLVVFFCGTTGALAGGFCASWLHRFGFPRGNLLVALVGFVALVPLTVGFPLVPTPALALAMIGAMNFFAGFNLGGGLAALQDLTPNRMRALVSAGYMLLANLVGGTLGPTVVALITDYGYRDPQRLPEAIAITCAIFSPLALVFLLIGMKGLKAAQSAEDIA
ncbi:MAG: MFS transporter [Sphingomonas sp.]